MKHKKLLFYHLLPILIVIFMAQTIEIKINFHSLNLVDAIIFFAPIFYFIILFIISAVRSKKD